MSLPLVVEKFHVWAGVPQDVLHLGRSARGLRVL